MKFRIGFGLCLFLAATCSAFGQQKSNQVAVTVSLSTNQGDYTDSWILKSDKGISIRHQTLYRIIFEVYPDSLTLIDEADLPDTKYDVELSATNAEDEDYWKALEPALRERFSLVISPEKRTLEIYEIRLKTNPPPGLKLSQSSGQPSKYTTNLPPFRLLYIRHSMDELESDLNRVMPLPVYNETGLTNDYDFSLDGFALTDPDKAVKSVKDLGLSLDKVKKDKDVLVIRKIHLNLLSVPK